MPGIDRFGDTPSGLLGWLALSVPEWPETLSRLLIVPELIHPVQFRVILRYNIGVRFEFRDSAGKHGLTRVDAMTAVAYFERFVPDFDVSRQDGATTVSA